MRIRFARRFRAWSLLCLATTSGPPLLAGDHALVRLGRALERELATLARGRAVELAELDDRSGRDLGRDLRALLRALAAGVPPALRAEAVLVEGSGRLTVSARVTDPATGELVGLVTASEALDHDWLDLRSLGRPSTRQAIDVLERSLSGPLPETVVDVAWIGRRLVLLSRDRVRLAEVRGNEVEVRHELELPGPEVPTRAPAGRLHLGEDGRFWALSNGRGSAALVEVRGSRLLARGSADALPAEAGLPPLRFRPGTNQLIAHDAPTWRLLRASGPLGIDPDGELVAVSGEGASPIGFRVGSSLCPLWQDLWLASSSAPPGQADALLVLAVDAGSARALERLEAPGSVVALAARSEGARAHVVAAVEAFGAERLLFLELARREDPDLPGPER